MQEFNGLLAGYTLFQASVWSSIGWAGKKKHSDLARFAVTKFDGNGPGYKYGMTVFSDQLLCSYLELFNSLGRAISVYSSDSPETW